MLLKQTNTVITSIAILLLAVTNLEAVLLQNDITKATDRLGSLKSSQQILDFSTYRVLGGLFQSNQVKTTPLLFDNAEQFISFDPENQIFCLLEQSFNGQVEFTTQTRNFNSLPTVISYDFAFTDLALQENVKQSQTPISRVQSTFVLAGPFCSPSYIHLAIPSSLNHTYAEELVRFNELSGFCNFDSFLHDYDLLALNNFLSTDQFEKLFENNETHEHSSSEANIGSSPTPVLIPEPATLISLGLGAMMLLRLQK